MLMETKSIILKRDVVSFFLGALLAVLVLSVWYSHHMYYQIISGVRPASICYKGNTIISSFNAEYVDLFTDSKRTFYFGKLESSEKIEIIIPGKVTMIVYPRDDDSVFLTYAPHNGIRRNYVLYQYGSFNKHLKVLYEMTGNEVFNETVDPPETE